MNKDLRVSRRIGVAGLGVTVVAALLVAAPWRATASDTPGTRPTGSGVSPHVLPAPGGSPGLQLVVNERGHISKSIDAAAGGTLTVHKPAAATVRGAYLAYATTGFSSGWWGQEPLTRPVQLLGHDVPLSNQVTSNIDSYNYFADVTELVKPTLDAASPGMVSIPVTEGDPFLTEGEILTVIYNDPSVQADQTVSILYGALNPHGDQYGIQLARPIDTGDPRTKLEMSLGISFSYQDFGMQQYSTVDVNGQRLTTSAGGEDDGYHYSSALITAGGEGDSPDNPSDPYAIPTNPRSDDELYDLRPFVHNGDCSAPPTAGTARSPSDCPTSPPRHPCSPARAQDSAHGSSAR